jgi:hypothetical protein
MRVLVADFVSLAVVHSLVMAIIQMANIGGSVYAKKCCPISLGVLCRQQYNEKEHQGEHIGLDPYDRRRWADGRLIG